MQITKITYGFVTQVFDTDFQSFVRQDFEAEDHNPYYEIEGEPVDAWDFEASLTSHSGYLPFDMMQPDTISC